MSVSRASPRVGSRFSSKERSGPAAERLPVASMTFPRVRELHSNASIARRFPSHFCPVSSSDIAAAPLQAQIVTTPDAFAPPPVAASICMGSTISPPPDRERCCASYKKAKCSPSVMSHLRPWTFVSSRAVNAPSRAKSAKGPFAPICSIASMDFKLSSRPCANDPKT